MTIHRSVCPYDCPDTCGLLVEVKNDRAIRVTGDPPAPPSPAACSAPRCCTTKIRYTPRAA